MAAGVIALVLEANPELRWRDVQHITIRNAQVGIRIKDTNPKEALNLISLISTGCKSESHRLGC